jgi:hypothetical protein
MFKTIGTSVLASSLVLLCGVDVAYAQRQAPAFRPGRDVAPQTINFTFGAFVPKDTPRAGGGDADVLDFDSTFLDFSVSDFKTATLGVEYLLPIGKFVEAGAGLSFTRRTVPSTYIDFIANDGSEIQQDLKMRRIPFDFTARVLPLGPSSHVQPYFGGGLSVVAWRYTETGEFVDFTQGGTIFRDTFSDSGSAVGPVILGGVRYASEAFSVGGEFRWHKAEADLDPDNFEAPKIDLGGWSIQATFGVRFD